MRASGPLLQWPVAGEVMLVALLFCRGSAGIRIKGLRLGLRYCHSKGPSTTNETVSILPRPSGDLKTTSASSEYGIPYPTFCTLSSVILAPFRVSS